VRRSIRQQIAQYSEEVKVVTVGTVFQVMVFARIYGLEKWPVNFRIEDGTVGIALNLETKMLVQF
jgi:F0F1-type ATP synthase alpha subunit